ncbi:MAG TPA: hypothetical protein PLJ35_18945 [Anaerolineae bacterium]|nr:hypothetical protein [Anaerolineae bacterium]HOR00896.1 hypothetical protein [Anaerolineae bacterium]HPL29795.1 hypothetical protein [Anaerolineae bacterium]
MAAVSRTLLPVLLLHNLDPDWPPCDIDEVLRQAAEAEAALRAQGHPFTGVPVRHADLAAHLHGYEANEHIVLNWCEELPGMPHSDALVAKTLQSLGFCYTGAAHQALALSWDKRQVKRLLDRSGLPTPRWRVYSAPEAGGWDCFPAIVKPAREHCSYGVTSEAVVLTPAELCARIAYVLETFQQPALVEDFVDGRELHVSLWGNGVVQMLPPAEMDFAAFADVRDRLCTYDSKFSPGSPQYDGIELRLPAALSEDELARLERIALATYCTLGCRDYARLDIRLRDGTFYVLDVNPNPDISSDTSTALAAEAAGYSYGAMLSRLVGLAAQRHPTLAPQASGAQETHG